MYREGGTDSPNMLPTVHLVTMIHGQAFFIITLTPPAIWILLTTGLATYLARDVGFSPGNIGQEVPS